MSEKKREELVADVMVALINSKLVGIDDVFRRSRTGTSVRGKFFIELAAAVSDSLAVAAGEIPYEKKEKEDKKEK